MRVAVVEMYWNLKILTSGELHNNLQAEGVTVCCQKHVSFFLNNVRAVATRWILRYSAPFRVVEVKHATQHCTRKVML